ncbi:MAG: exonuclease domain-containing protein [Campylobacterota bacterium]|nr:exonuclease domain-containing protein [Campylobacterota bacterium]
MLIYLDLETTGVEKKDRICAIGLIAVEGEDVTVMNDLVKPPRKIRPEAMAVHHITNEMVSDKPPFLDSETVKWLSEHNSADNVLIAHNVDFELTMLQREGIVWQGAIIDTLKCTKHLIKEVEKHSLQYLRYELGLYKSEVKAAKTLDIPLIAHTVLSDALHAKLLHEYLNEMADDERLFELTVERALIQKFNFGKYSGRYIEEIAMRDPGYLEWMLGNMFDMDEDLRYSVEYYMRETR